MIVYIATTFFRMRVMNEDKEKSAVYKRILRSAKLAGFDEPSLINKKGTVKVDFKDADFANEFAQANEGVLPANSQWI